MKLLKIIVEVWLEARDLRAQAARNHFRIAPTV